LKGDIDMRLFLGFVIVISACIIPFQLSAAGVKDSKPLLCSVIKAYECGLESGCIEGTAESIDIPQFIQVDFKNNKISTTRANKVKRESTINNLQRVDGKIFMQGVENGRGWSMVIEETSGKMSASALEERVSFTVFGACTAL
jgi:hypothetical protein